MWPPSFPLAKAYTDQLERKGCVSAAKISDIRGQIATAEKGTSAARNAALGKLVTDLDGSRSCDAHKVDLLKKTLQDLRSPAM